MKKASKNIPTDVFFLCNCDCAVKSLILCFLCILHTLMIKLAITIDEDILLTLVWEEVTPTCSVMLTSLWIYELFMEMN